VLRVRFVERAARHQAVVEERFRAAVFLFRVREIGGGALRLRGFRGIRNVVGAAVA
jgi:hypothetical protein